MGWDEESKAEDGRGELNRGKLREGRSMGRDKNIKAGEQRGVWVQI